MKLAILCDAIYPFHHGGKETLQHERAIRLARRGHAVRIHTMHWWREPESEIVRDGVVLDAVGPRVRMYGRHGRRTIRESLLFGLASLRLLWAPAFDVLDVDQFPFTPFFAARLVCGFRRRPMTATWHEVWDRDYWRAYMGWLAPVGIFLQQYAARSADLVFANSKLTARRLTDWLGVEPKRIIVLPLGVSAHPSPSRLVGEGRGGGLDKTIDCIFVGRLLPHKHVDVFLRALAELPAVSGLIIGSGPEKERLLALCRELGIESRARFESAADHDGVRRSLSAARLLVLPSTREGFGVTVLEANACGVPALVVADPDNAATELISEGLNGFVCEPDPVAIARRIAEFLSDPAAQARMREAAIATAARYSWDAYVNRMEAALDRLVAPTQQEKAA